MIFRTGVDADAGFAITSHIQAWASLEILNNLPVWLTDAHKTEPDTVSTDWKRIWRTFLVPFWSINLADAARPGNSLMLAYLRRHVMQPVRSCFEPWRFFRNDRVSDI